MPRGYLEKGYVWVMGASTVYLWSTSGSSGEPAVLTLWELRRDWDSRL